MISASGMWGATSLEASIIRTAPIAKFGATKTLALPSALVTPVRSSSGSKPVLPTTACTPTLIASMTLAGAASGVVKSTITSAPSIRSATEVSSAGSARPASSTSSATSTAAQTVSPTAPPAPETRTLIASAMVGDLMLLVRDSDRGGADGNAAHRARDHRSADLAGCLRQVRGGATEGRRQGGARGPADRGRPLHLRRAGLRHAGAGRGVQELPRDEGLVLPGCLSGPRRHAEGASAQRGGRRHRPLGRDERLVDRRQGRAEALLARGDSRRRERRGLVELAGELANLVARHSVDLLDQLVECQQGRVEEDRLADPAHPRRGGFRRQDHPALDVLLGTVQLGLGDPVGVDRGKLTADDPAGLLDVVLAGADIQADQPTVRVLLRVGADGVGKAPLLPHLAEEPGRSGTAEDRVEDGDRVTALVGAIDAGAAEGDVELLSVLLLEGDLRSIDLRALERRAVTVAGGRRRLDVPPGELDDRVVIDVARGSHHDVR